MSKWLASAGNDTGWQLLAASFRHLVGALNGNAFGVETDRRLLSWLLTILFPSSASLQNVILAQPSTS
jgi:hypothetical protein